MRRTSSGAQFKSDIISVTELVLWGHTLEKADYAKYLGITIQNNLKWDKHINTITAKANQSLGFIKRTSILFLFTCSIEVLLEFYCIFVGFYLFVYDAVVCK
jgi:hypothetical protein